MIFLNRDPISYKNLAIRSATMRKFQSITVRNERPFRAFTGLPQKEFDRLLPDFTRCLEAISVHDKKITI